LATVPVLKTVER